jgi:penicillin-binding protein 1B
MKKVPMFPVNGKFRSLFHPARKIVAGVAALLLLLLFGGAAGCYHRYSGMIDERLSGKRLGAESRIFTAPRRIWVGEGVSQEELIAYLKASGYSMAADEDGAGRIVATDTSIQIRPSADSYFNGRNALSVDFSGGGISQLRSLDSGERLMSAEIEPELITGLFGRHREKRRPMSYGELPPILLQAVLCTEDRRFFEHPGFDPVRVIGAAWTDIRRGEKAQGASTITMQVARSFFFSTKRQWRRKARETLMALVLEHRFSKEKIFELYANEVYLGNRGSYAIHGFGEAAQAYFGRDLRELSLAQYAFLAGIIHAPNRYSSAERRPERGAEARDRVLVKMKDAGVITAEVARSARGLPLGLVRGTYGASPSGHFVDMVKDDLLDRFSEDSLGAQRYRIYTTLDSDLQRAAMEAVEWGLANVDAQLEKTYARLREKGEKVLLPQVALVALDPHTGEVKALVGGRDYASSQLNHCLTRRQPGSVFKPFVYAAALESALTDEGRIWTPISQIVDEPTVFYFDGKEYKPDNYGGEYLGPVTVRDALVHSLNVATVKLAAEVGYGHVARFARRMGLPADIKPTPAMALGAYELSPLEVARGYTPLANYGSACEPLYLRSVRNAAGDSIHENPYRRRAVLDPRVAYLVTDMMEDVIDRGTGAGVRRRGLRVPAAGKTGTSHDGWFAGYTTNLLTVVWVGFDDNRELRLSGAHSAGPIWGEFMKRAVSLPGFSDARSFERPEGVVEVSLDADSLMLAQPECPVVRREVFIAGTEPTEFCPLHGTSTMDRLLRPFSWMGDLF